MPIPATPRRATDVGYKRGGFIQHAIKRPGRMHRLAEREGKTVHQVEEEHQGDSGSLGAAARLGLRLTAMSKHRKG